MIFGSAFSTGCGGNESDKETASVKPTKIGDEPISFEDGDEYLVKDGKSDYKIVVGADATKVEKYAAEELQYFVEKSTAVKLPIATDGEVSHGDNGKYISVGENKLLSAEKDIKIDYEELGENGVTVNTKGNCVYVAGATENGTLFAVYRFLHYQVGYNAYAYDCVEVDYFRSVKLKNITYKHVPSIGLTTAEDGELSGEDKETAATICMAISITDSGVIPRLTSFRRLSTPIAKRPRRKKNAPPNQKKRKILSPKLTAIRKTITATLSREIARIRRVTKTLRKALKKPSERFFLPR